MGIYVAVDNPESGNLKMNMKDDKNSDEGSLDRFVKVLFFCVLPRKF